MSGNLLQRLGWPGLGLGLTVLLAAQTGVASRQEPCSIAASLGLDGMRKSSAPLPTSSPTTPAHVAAEGRVAAYPGAEVVVSAEVAGRIMKLEVKEKSTVRRGDLLVELNSDDLRASLAEAEARIREAEADERFSLRELRREQGLMARHAGTVQNIDSLNHRLESAAARRGAAIATRDRFAALIAKTRILAPIDGVVTARHVQPGETIEAAADLVTIVDLDQLRVEAEVDEYDTARVSLAARVEINAEGYRETWRGTIEEIPDTVVGRKLRPDDPGRPIDARVLPVKIHLAGGHPLKLGQRVEVRIEATERTGEAAASPGLARAPTP